MSLLLLLTVAARGSNFKVSYEPLGRVGGHHCLVQVITNNLNAAAHLGFQSQVDVLPVADAQRHRSANLGRQKIEERADYCRRR